MYSKQEAANYRKEFWTSFGQYMAPIPSSDGEKINWVNYKSGEKNIFFRMEADQHRGKILIELAHDDLDLQQLYFEQFLELKNLLHTTLEENWIWQPLITSENGRVVSRIYQQLDGVSIFNKSDWPKLISFFKKRIIALDEFWSGARYSFESLR